LEDLPMVGKKSFQWLEDFPMVGKKSSNDWKKREKKFQRLETFLMSVFCVFHKGQLNIFNMCRLFKAD